MIIVGLFYAIPTITADSGTPTIEALLEMDKNNPWLKDASLTSLNSTLKFIGTEIQTSNKSPYGLGSPVHERIVQLQQVGLLIKDEKRIRFPDAQ